MRRLVGRIILWFILPLVKDEISRHADALATPTSEQWLAAKDEALAAAVRTNPAQPPGAPS